MVKMEMQWKEFNVDLRALDASLRGSYPHYVGNQACDKLELWFDQEPSDSDKTAIQALWDGIASDSAMATSYQSAASLEAAAEAAAESGKAKLKALGLSDAEVAALLG